MTLLRLHDVIAKVTRVVLTPVTHTLPTLSPLSTPDQNSGLLESMVEVYIGFQILCMIFGRGSLHALSPHKSVPSAVATANQTN